jgi:hypothetical protein
MPLEVCLKQREQMNSLAPTGVLLRVNDFRHRLFEDVNGVRDSFAF